MGVFKKGRNFYIDYYLPNGRRRREMIGPSKKRAMLALDKRRVQIAEGKFFDIKKEEKIPFGKMAMEYLEVYSRPNKRSSRRDEISAKHLVSFFGGSSLQEVTPLDAEKYKQKRINEVSPNTVNRELACLKHIFSKAKEWGKIKENPISSVKLFRVDDRRVRYLKKEEIAKLAESCSDYLRPIVIFAINTGMRKGEILNLKCTDIDLGNRIISLAQTKNREIREIPINDTVLDLLIRLRKNSKGSHVFSKKDGTPYKDIRGGFRSSLQKAGIRDFRFHDLRHTFASHLVMAGIDLKTVQELLGHKTLQMTLRYSHLSRDHKRRAINTLGRRLDTIWTPEAERREREKIAHYSDLLYDGNLEGFAGVAEWVDAVDLKSTG